jgi:hypothetical protein
MGVADDLKTLQDLHDKGKLTDAEFAAAKASILSGKPKPKVRAGFIILLLVFLALIGWHWYANQGSPQTATIATVLHVPMQLKDEIENVPAHSFRAIPFSVPYLGNLTVTVSVVHGNPMDVFVTGTDQFANLQALKWSEVRTYGDFDASKTQTYERTSQLPIGSYYLVLRDTSLGILSASASDISVKMRLAP